MNNCNVSVIYFYVIKIVGKEDEIETAKCMRFRNMYETVPANRFCHDSQKKSSIKINESTLDEASMLLIQNKCFFLYI